jgi:hypothetical protein
MNEPNTTAAAYLTLRMHQLPLSLVSRQSVARTDPYLALTIALLSSACVLCRVPWALHCP